MDKTYKHILTQLKNIDSNLDRQNSFKRGFLFSVVQGIGTAIGTTLFAGIVIAVLYKVIISIDTLPLIQKIFPSSTINQILPQPVK